MTAKGVARRVLMIEPLGRGGIADYTAELVGSLVRSGRRVELLTAADHAYNLPSSVRVHGLIKWVRAHSRRGDALRRWRLSPALNALRYTLGLPRVARLARTFDIVHVQGPYHPPLLTLTLALLRVLGVRTVQTPHNTFDRGRQYRLFHRLNGALTSAMVVHVKADLSNLPPAAAGRAVIIPHGEYGALARQGGQPDSEKAREELGLPSTTPVALLFGQLREDKGIEDFALAIAQVPSVNAVIAGEDIGGLAAARTQLSDARLSGRVAVREGFHSMTAVSQFFAAADVVVLPYRKASQSGVLLLAYGFRRPVVVYPCGGLPEAVVDGSTGWICGAPEPSALAESLRAVTSAGRTECRRRGELAADLARSRYSWESIGISTGQLYDRL